MAIPSPLDAPSEAARGPVRLLVNTKSRRGQEWFESVQERLDTLGVEVDRAQSFEDMGELIKDVKNGIRDGVPVIACGGGDGTFSAVARLFAGQETILGVLPLGTGNAFARDLGIEADVDKATAIIAAGRTAHVDAGFIGDDYFVNVATLGLTTRIARNLTVENKRKFGRFVYALALWNAMRDVKPFRVKLTTENGEREFETLQTVIGVGRYHAGPLPLSPDASITDGRLSIYALRAAEKTALLKMALKLPTGTQGDLDEVHSEECRTGRIETFPPVSITVDGEVCARTPADFRIAPRALRVLVPDSFTG